MKQDNASRRGLIWGALIVLSAVVAIGLARAWTARSERQFRAHLQTASLPELQALAKQRDWDPAVYYVLGARYMNAGRYQEAVEALARSAALNPRARSTQTLLQAATVQRNQAHLQQASLSDLRALAEKQPRNPEINYWLGVRLSESGLHEEAAKAQVRSLAFNPKSAAAHAALGLELARLNHPAEAEAQLKQAIELNPKLPFAHFTLGNLYGKYKRWEQAAAELKIAVEQAPDDLEAQYLLADCYGQMYLDDRKMDILEHLVQKDPNNPRYLKSLGYVYLFFNRFADAEAAYRRILQNQPDDVEAHYLIGRALAEQANTPQGFATAERELKTATTAESDNPSGHLALGILYFRQNQPARAVPELEKAIRLGITERRTWLYLGQAYARIGRTAEAKRTLDSFQSYATFNRQVSHLENRLFNIPDDNEARLRLARVYMDAKDYPRALNHLTLLLEKDKGNKEAQKMERDCLAHLPKSS